MFKSKQFFIVSILSILTIGCGFYGKIKDYQITTDGFVTALMSKNYDKAITYFDLENPEFASNVNRDTLKVGIASLYEALSKNFGTNLKVTTVSASKTFDTRKKENLPANAIKAKAIFEGDVYFGYLTLILNENNGKIMNVNIDNFREPKPKTTNVYIFLIFGLLVVAFNIYMIVRVVSSKIVQKWKRIVTILLLNVPTFGYNAVSGFFFSLLNFQFLLGVSFNLSDYASTSCAIGVPIGALIVFWKMKNDLYFTEEPEIQTDRRLIDNNDTPSV